MILLTLSVVATVGNLVIYYRGASGPLPLWMRDLFLYVLPHLLRMQTPRRLDDEDDTLLPEPTTRRASTRAFHRPNSATANVPLGLVRQRVIRLASDLRTTRPTGGRATRSQNLEQRIGHALAELETVAQQQRRALADERVRFSGISL